MGLRRKAGDDDDAKQVRPVFSVDTHLFRELGNHLVGRDSTALIELVKNAYDADATEVVVIGSNLSDRNRAKIVITDNGSGMDEVQFRSGFLRIAARGKESGDRRSPVYKRRYTGAKGIGRLAAHKLAEHLFVYSVSGQPGGASLLGVDAEIDWGAIEKLHSLEEIGDEVKIRPLKLKTAQPCGTKIELHLLRKAWNDDERTYFVQECTSLQAPKQLASPLPTTVLAESLLFQAPRQRLTSDVDKGFVLKLEGEFDTGEGLWSHISSSAEWVLEIDASRPAKNAKAVVKYGIAPTRNRLARQKGIKAEVYTKPHPKPDEGPFFHARMLIQVKPRGSREDRRELRKESGIRVYVEGFRVLPYGDEGNDWLNLDADYTRRSPLKYAAEVEAIFASTQEDKKWGSLILANRSYFGAVFLTQDDAGDLTPLINREGFLPNPAYYRLREIVRIGIDLFTRVRASIEYEERIEARTGRKLKKSEPVRGGAVLKSIEEAKTLVGEIRLAVSKSDVAEASDGITELISRLDTLQERLGEFVSETDILRVTASVGTQMAEFVHEVQGLLGTTEAVDEALERMRNDQSLSTTKRSELSAIHTNVADMRKQLERQASYLLDIATPNASRRRSQQKLAERFTAATKLVIRAAEKREIEILNEIDPGVKSPPMFPAEITTVFSNLLTNAVKNAGDEGVIRASSRTIDKSVRVVIQNTGTKVDLEDSERLFRPFVSTTTEVDTLLGQGLGLGLTITRNTLEEYGASIEFIAPNKGFQTAIQITFPT